MRVGLTMRVVHPQGYQEPRDAISHDWMRLFEEMGWSPRLIPNRVSDVAAMVDEIDALILTGGNDLGADLSGLNAAEVRDMAPERDRQEGRLLQEAARRALPTVGVCRGLQMINCHYGGRLVRVDSAAHVATRHRVRIDGEPWQSLLGAGADVNSFHNCGVAVDSLGDGLVAFATGEDGTVEGIHHRSLPLVGLMWHPERCDPLTRADGELLRRLFIDGPFWTRAK
jgi:gamma-glutamyl-gamma-aminobutyrate hydrolase PuuD